jgi:hypothetical protein
VLQTVLPIGEQLSTCDIVELAGQTQNAPVAIEVILLSG